MITHRIDQEFVDLPDPAIRRFDAGAAPHSQFIGRNLLVFQRDQFHRGIGIGPHQDRAARQERPFHLQELGLDEPLLLGQFFFGAAQTDEVRRAFEHHRHGDQPSNTFACCSTHRIARLVPVSMVLESTPNFIRLRGTEEELAQQQRFIQTEFLEVEGSFLSGSPILMPPYPIPRWESVPLEHEQIPPDELAVRRGTRVEATDGRVGRVDEFLVDPVSDHITHLIMREGHLWVQKTYRSRWRRSTVSKKTPSISS